MDKLYKIGYLKNPKVEELGGKIYWLDKIKKAGFNVPKGYIINITIFKEFLEVNNIEFDVTNNEVFKFDNIRQKVYVGEFSERQTEYLFNIFNNLKKPIIVRSSGVHEDSDLTSCAGLFVTVDQVFEFNNFLEAIKLCWISTFNEMLNIVIGQDRDYGINLLVQEELEATIGGVAFSINPVTNNLNEIIVEASKKGPKDAVVGNGNVERFTILRTIENQSKDIINRKIKESILDIEQLMQVNVDMEWLCANEELFIIQARPITTVKKQSNVRYISIDNPEVLTFRLKNCLATHARWIEKKDIIRKKCIENNIKIGQFYYYFLSEDKDITALTELLDLLKTPVIEIYNGESCTLVKKEEVKIFISNLKYDVLRIGESIKTDIAGFSTIIEDKIYFEAVMGGFSGFYSGDFIPTKYVTDLNGNVENENCQIFNEEYALINNQWKKQAIESYELKLNKNQIKQICTLTKKLTNSFNGVRIEWIISDNDIYLFDVTIEKTHMEDIYCNGNTISKGSCEGEIRFLDDVSLFDDYADDISVRMGHAFEKLNNQEQLKKLKINLGLKNKIIVCDYPKEHLALLVDEAIGFIFERGSLLCHLGIILREKNIPAVILEDAKTKLTRIDKIQILDGNIIY